MGPKNLKSATSKNRQIFLQFLVPKFILIFDFHFRYKFFFDPNLDFVLGTCGVSQPTEAIHGKHSKKDRLSLFSQSAPWQSGHMRSDPALNSTHDTGYVPKQAKTMYNNWEEPIVSKFVRGLHPDFNTLAKKSEWVKEYACHRCDENGDNALKKIWRTKFSAAFISSGSGCFSKNSSVGYVYLVLGCY